MEQIVQTSVQIQARSVKTVFAVAVAYFAFFGAVFLSVSAGAAVHAPGTFVPSECGEAVDQPFVSKVCRGHIVGEQLETEMGAFEFRDADGHPAVYRVTAIQHQMIKLMSGGKRSNVFMVSESGDEISMKVNRMADGSLQAAAGVIGQAKFFVPAFTPVMTTMAAL